jgi:hypothetical protein
VAVGGTATFAAWQQNVHGVMGPNDPNTNIVEALAVIGEAAPWRRLGSTLFTGIAEIGRSRFPSKTVKPPYGPCGALGLCNLRRRSGQNSFTK